MIKQQKTERKYILPTVILKGPTMHCVKQVRLTNICRGSYKMSAGKVKQFEQHCSGSNQSSLRASHLESIAVFRRFLSSVFQFKNAFQECVQSGFPRFHERWKFAGRMLSQLFTTDSLDRPFIQRLFRRLHPGGTTVKWILSTLVKPGSVDTIYNNKLIFSRPCLSYIARKKILWTWFSADILLFRSLQGNVFHSWLFQWKRCSIYNSIIDLLFIAVYKSDCWRRV